MESNDAMVEKIYWPDGTFLTAAGDTCELVCCDERGAYWILEMKKGKEFARHNVKSPESIERK